jgi:hypothetical protein
MYTLYGDLCPEYIEAYSLTEEIQGNTTAHYHQALTSKLCAYIIWSTFCSSRDFFRLIYNPVRRTLVPSSSIRATISFLKQGQLGEPIGFPFQVCGTPGRYDERLLAHYASAQPVSGPPR